VISSKARCGENKLITMYHIPGQLVLDFETNRELCVLCV